MKFLKVAVMSAIALAWSSAYAFHSGGVAECEGCHSMHNSSGLDTMVSNTTYGQGSGPYLLVGSDQSSACLSCHGAGATLSGYHVSTSNISTATNSGSIPAQMTPGGDFSWLKITTTFAVRGTPSTVYGESRGHNVVAADFGYVADPELTVAPGGTYPNTSLSCISCHDPHGKARRFADGSYALTGLPIANSGSYNNSANPISGIYAVGAYRILGGQTYLPKSQAALVPAFVNQVPSAVAPSTYNREETLKDQQTYVAYGQGMSEWCGNCHGNFIQSGYTSGMAGLRHPAGNNSKLTNVFNNYNNYVTSGIMTGGAVNNRFSTLTPYEIGSNDFAGTLKPFANQVAADRSATAANNVACVSCHRAHAGGFAEGLRFFYSNEFMTIGNSVGTASYETNTLGNGNRSQGLTPAQITAAYYNRPASWFGPYARMQCNKCHAKD